MSGNTYGKLFTVTTAGESHGPALVAIVDGCPPGLELSADDLQRDLDRRKPGTSRHTTQRQEADEVEILSGVFEGRTTGCPIGLLIRNTDQKSKDYSAIKDQFRPAHADYSYHHKYGCATIAAVAAARRAKPPCASPLAPSPRNTWPPWASSGARLHEPAGPDRNSIQDLGQRRSRTPFSAPTRTRCRSWRPTWISCAVTRIRSARRSPSWPKA
jgi:hypothetical protein